MGGVYVDTTERIRILQYQQVIAKYLDETQPHDPALWFEDREFEDPDFPSGRCVGTREVNGKCAFLDKQKRCSLQVAAVEEGLHRWFFKPMYCVLFPIEISERMIRFDDLLQGDEACCSVTGDYEMPLFEVCKDELVHLLGEEGFGQLREHYQKRLWEQSHHRESP
jgi:Fe-S-cluster containining protein